MPDPLLLEFDERLFSVEALQKAAYRSMNYFTVDFAISDGVTTCTLHPNGNVSDCAFVKAIEEFKKDVLDYQLRQKLAAQTESVRNVILSLAFSKTKLQA